MEDIPIPSFGRAQDKKKKRSKDNTDSLESLVVGTPEALKAITRQVTGFGNNKDNEQKGLLKTQIANQREANRLARDILKAQKDTKIVELNLGGV